MIIQDFFLGILINIGSIFKYDKFRSFRRFTHSKFIYGSNTKLCHLSFPHINSRKGKRCRCSRGVPYEIIFVHMLNNIVLYWRPSIINRRIET